MNPSDTAENTAMADILSPVSDGLSATSVTPQAPAQPFSFGAPQPIAPAQSFSPAPTPVTMPTPVVEPAPFSAPTPEPPAPQGPKHPRHHHLMRWIIGAALLLALGAVTAMILFSRQTPSTARSATESGSYDIQGLDLSDLVQSGDLGLLTNQSLSINGRLNANGGLVLAPSSRPDDAVQGQIYYDEVTNVPYYYDGTNFVGLGASAFTAGTGISINGTTITTSAVLGLRTVSPQLSFTRGSNGEYTLNTVGEFATATGSAGSIAMFDATSNLVSSIISQTSGAALVGGDLKVSGAVQTNTISSLTPGQEFNLTAGNGQLVLTSEGRHFQLPSTGAVNQTICTVGMDCATGGGTVYIQLQPGAVQSDAGSGPSIFVNNSGGGSLLRLQGSGLDRFVVANNGDTAISGNLAVSGTVNGATISGGNISGGTVNGAYISGGTVTGGSLSDTEVNGLGLTNAGITSTGALTLVAANNQNLNLNTSGTGIVTLGSSQLQGAGALTISAGGTNQNLTLTGSGLGKVIVQTPEFHNANGATYVFDAADLSGVNATICTSAGNCIGSGAGVGGSGTPGTIAVWDGTGFTLSDSILSQSAGVVTVLGDLAATNLSGNGASITSVNAAQLNGQSASYYLNATNIASGTLADARLSSAVTLQGNTFNGVSQLVQTNGSGYLPSLNGSLLTSVNAAQLNGQSASYYLNATNIASGTLADARLSANVALLGSAANFTSTLQQNGDDVCTVAGNCAGTGAGVGGSGTVGTIAIWDGSGFTLTDSILTQAAGTVTVAGDLAATNLQGNGSSITNLNASNLASGTVGDARLSANVALLNATANFTGSLQQAGNAVCTTAGNCVGSGPGGSVGGSGTAGVIAVWNGTGFTLGDSLLSQSGGTVTVTGDFAATNLQGNGSAVTNVDADLLDGLDSTAFAPASGSGNYIRNGTSAQTANIAVQSAAAGSIGVLIQGATSQTADLLQLQDSVGGVLAKVDASGVVTAGGFILSGNGGPSTLPAIQGASGQRIFTTAGQNGWGIGNTGGSTDIRTSDGTSSVSLGSSGGGDVQIKRGSTSLWINPGTGSGQYIRYDSGGGAQRGYIDNNMGQYYALQNSGTVGIQLKAAAGQTADLIQLQDSTGAVLSAFNASGNLGLGTTTPGSYKLNVQSGDANFGGNLASGGTTRLDNAGQLLNITGYSQTSGNFSQAGVGTFTTGTGAVTLAGATTASSTLTVAGTGTFQSTLSVTGAGFINAGSTLNTALSLGDFPTGGSIGTAATTVDTHTSIAITQTTAGQILSLPAPNTATAGRIVYILNNGSVDFTMGGITVPAGYGQLFIWNGTAWTLGASGGGAAITLQGAYDGGNTINTTNARDIMFGLANTATDGNFVLNIATSSTGQFKIQNAGSDVLTVGSAGQINLAVQGSSGGLAVGGDTLLYRSATNRLQMNNALTLKNTTDTSSAFQIQDSLGASVLTVDTSNKKIFAGGDLRFEQPLSTRSKIVYKDTTNNLEFGTGYQQDPGFFWIGLQNNSDGNYLTGMTKNTSYYSAGLRTAVSGTRAGIDFIVGDSVSENLDSFTPMSLLTIGGTTSLTLQGHTGGDALVSFQGLNTTTNAVTDRGLLRYQQNQVLFDNYTGGSLVVRTGTNSGDVVNRLFVGNNGTGDIALIVRGVTSQTGDLQQWQDSTSAVLARVTASGVVQGASFDVATASAMNVGSTNATAINLNQNTTIASGKSLTVTGGNTGSRPASPTEGMVYYDQTTKQLLTYSNGKWQSDSKAATVIVAPGGATQTAKDGAQYVGDGTNDQNAINSAIAALPASGGSVVLAEGTFNLTGTISMNKDNVKLVGQGKSTILKRMFNETTANTSGAITLTASSLTIADLYLDGNKASYTNTNNHGILWSTNRSNLTMRDISVTNSAGNGIDAEWNILGTNGYGTDIEINNVAATSNNGLGIVLSRMYGLNVVGSLMNSNGGTGLDVSEFEGSIANNTSKSNSSQGMILSGAGTTTASVSGNTISNNASYGLMGGYFTATSNIANSNGSFGVYLIRSYTVFSNNTVNDNAYGILTQDSYITVSGNTISNNIGEGIATNGGSGNKFTDNYVYNNGSTFANAGIYINATNTTISGNRIIDTAGTGYAIKVETGTTGTYLSGNTYSGTGATSISDNGTGTVWAGQLDASGTSIFTGPIASPSILTSLVDTSSATALSIGSINATAINLNQSTTIAAGKSLTVIGGITASRPASPTAGMVYYDQTTNQLLTYANGKWQGDSKAATVVVAPGGATQTAKDGAQYVGDGTNDQNAINSAIAALPASGGSIVLAEGTFNLTGTVSMNKDNVKLVGQGKSTILKRMFNETTANASGAITITASSLTLADFYIDGNKAAYTNTNNDGILWSTNRSNLTLRDLTVTNSAGNGIRSEWNVLGTNGFGNDVSLHNIAATSNTGSGIVLASTNSLDVTGSTTNSNGSNGMYVSGFEGNITSNTSKSNGQDGMVIYGTGSGTASVTGNTTSSNTQFGLIGGYFTATSNIMTANGSIGAYLLWSDTIFSNNLVNNNGNTGVGVQDTRTTVSGNMITGNAGEGILISGSNNKITANYLYNNASGAFESVIYIGGNGNTVTGNKIIATAGTGYAIEVVTGSTGTYLSGNTYSGTGATSILDNGTGTIWEGQVDANGKTVFNTGELVKGDFTVQNTASVNLFGVNAGSNTVTLGTANSGADTFTKLSNPASLPTNTGTDTAWSPDGQYMSVAQSSSPYINIYKRSGDTFTKLANPATLPTGYGTGTAWSPDGQYMSVTHATSPYITIYKRSGDTFTKLTDPATLPTGQGKGASWSPDGLYLSVGHSTSPYVTIYKRSGDTFTKLTNPATLPTGNVVDGGTTWTPDGQYLSVSHYNSPYITTYKRAGDTFTKLANPATLPSGYGYIPAWSPDGQYLSLPTDGSPYIYIYKRSGDVLTKLANPATLPPSSGYGSSWSPDGVYLSVGHNATPYITIYKRSGDTFTKLTNPASLPGSDAFSTAFSPDGQYMSVAHNSSPYISIYKIGDGQTANVTVNGLLNGASATFSTLNVLGATTLQSSLLVQGAAVVNENLSVGGTLTVAGASTLSGSLTVAGATVLSGTLNVTGATTVANITVNGHIIGGGSAPTIAAGAAACTTPTVSISGTDTSGVITVTTGSAGCPASGKFATVTFATAFGAAPRVTLTSANGAAAGLQNYIDSATISTTAFDLSTNSAPVASTTYKWYFQVIQ